ncbi:MAG: hypothetical protein WD470_02580 [Rhodospirillaceae bacterium]
MAVSMPAMMPFPDIAIANNDDDQPENQVDDALMSEAILGFDRLRRMSPPELREVISSRVSMLETELRAREERRQAIETAQTAARILDIRRERAKRIHRNVNFGSALAAAAGTFLIVFVMV